MVRTDALATAGATAIRITYESYRRRFREITARARRRFERRDWLAGQGDAAERLELYPLVVRGAVGELKVQLGPLLKDPSIWRQMKALYADSIASYPGVEIAETFFNSVSRRLFATVGVDPDIEFVSPAERPRTAAEPGIAAYPRRSPEAPVRELVGGLLDATGLGLAAPDRDAELVAGHVEAAWAAGERGGPIESIELVDSVFFRGRAAYLVGRILGGTAALPLVIVLTHTGEGIGVDAVLLTEGEVSIVFSFTRSYFHVQLRHVAPVIRFLRAIMPRKPLAELYLSLGYHKHGKTEMYRDLLAHLRRSTDRFELAPGDVGMVMIVFTSPSYDYVFKVIRDRFAYPKTTTREDVMRRYSLVFKHDRAGRLVEAQEFEHLTFDTSRFAPDLLEELRSEAAGSVTIQGGEVAIHHIYVERRLEPLNLFLREAEDGAAREALLDYGQAIRDLAVSNIFPGDLLLKNFGVTRHGRVIFYDYDELCLVTDCHFRDLPTARHSDQELSGEPWFYVAPGDVFPEEFIHFLGLSKPQRELFLEAHGEVLTAAFWRGLQERHRAGEVLDVFPYPRSKRMRA